MDNVKVGVVQTFIAQEIRKNIEDCLKLTEKAAKLNAEIICLQEQWLSRNPYKAVDKLAKLMPQLIDRFRLLAEEYSTSILLGGCVEEVMGRKIVSCPVLGSNGSVIFKQVKTHLFKEEKKLFTPGLKLDTFKIRNLRVGILICYDLVFPETARILALKGADLIFNPSRIKREGVPPWHLYLKTRALENRIPFVGVNSVFPPNYNGKSLIVNLEVEEEKEIVYPVTVVMKPVHPGVTVKSLDVEKMRRYREERLAERNVKTYSALLKFPS